MWLFLLPFGVAVLVLLVLVRGFARHDAEVRSSRLVTVQATCTGKRTSGPHGEFCHATFELLDGSRIELGCSGADYGLLADGDVGALTYRYDTLLSFTRGMSVGRD